MTKSESFEIAKIMTYHEAGLGLDYVARALSALIRCARSTKSQNEIRTYALQVGVTNHPEFIC
jgi:hypothetical protein